MSLDGLELVLSRTAILDIFVMFWVLAAFGMLVLDRDASRAKLVELTTAPGADLSDGGPKLGIRWRRVLAGLFLGCACASKWNGIWFIFAFAAMSIAWDLGARRALGYGDRLRGVLRSDVKWLPVTFGIVPLAAYTAAWSGWFASSLGYDRNWAAFNGNHTPIWSTLDSWYQYQKAMLGFGLGLTSHAGYTSSPWSWLLVARPVSMFYNTPDTCGSAHCSQEVLAIGTPAIWWASIPALLFCLFWWISRRDWRAGAVLLAVARRLAALVLVRLARQPDRVLLLRGRVPALPDHRDHAVPRADHGPGVRHAEPAGDRRGDRRRLPAARGGGLRLHVPSTGGPVHPVRALAPADVVQQLDLSPPDRAPPDRAPPDRAPAPLTRSPVQSRHDASTIVT